MRRDGGDQGVTWESCGQSLIKPTETTQLADILSGKRKEGCYLKGDSTQRVEGGKKRREYGVHKFSWGKAPINPVQRGSRRVAGFGGKEENEEDKLANPGNRHLTSQGSGGTRKEVKDRPHDRVASQLGQKGGRSQRCSWVKKAIFGRKGLTERAGGSFCRNDESRA